MVDTAGFERATKLGEAIISDGGCMNFHFWYKHPLVGTQIVRQC